MSKFCWEKARWHTHCSYCPVSASGEGVLAPWVLIIRTGDSGIFRVGVCDSHRREVLAEMSEMAEGVTP